MTDGQTLGLISGVGCLALVGSSLLARRPPMRRTLAMAAAWAGIFTLLYVTTLFRAEAGEVWSRAKVDLFGAQPSLSGGRVTIPARDDGHFYVTGLVNGVRAEFLVDSGATETALTAATAAAAGVEDDGMPPIPMTTANGVAYAKTGRIGRLQIGGITQMDARTTIGQGLGDVNLLGMSFLSELKSWRVERGVLVLEP